MTPAGAGTGRGAGWRALLLFLAWATPAVAAPDYPALTGRVVDQAGLLSADARNEVESRLAAHEQATGEQVVVVTLDSLNGETIEDYGVGLGRHWGIGTKGEDNGALLIVAPNEREVRIEVGYGLEGKLTDALASQIIQVEILPRFRAGDMEGGIAAGAGAMLAVLDGSYVPGEWSLPNEVPAEQQLPIPFWATALLFFGVWLLLVMVIRRGRRRGLWMGGPGLGGLGGGTRGGGFSRGGGGFSGRGGSFGGGGSSGRW